MAPPNRYPAPPRQLLALLQREKHPRGLPLRSFDEVWQIALYGPRNSPDRIIFPHDTQHRRQWREALEETKGEWRAAYDEIDTPTSRTLSFLDPEASFIPGFGEDQADRIAA